MRLGTVAVVLAALALAACASDNNDGTAGNGPAVTFATTPGVGATTSGTGSSTIPGTTPLTTPLTAPLTSPLTTASVALHPFVSGTHGPVDVVWRPGDDTMFVVQQDGLIKVARGGTLGGTALDIQGKVSSGSEQGLLGLAFHPSKSLAYIDYTNTKGDTVIAEYAVRADGTFDPASARIVLTIAQPYPNHNGGKVVFGPDGHLYIGMGDGGSAFDPERRALDVGKLLGKILRIDPEASGGKPYTVPADNPFVGIAGARPEIWSVGVRNPWRFTFDSANGDLWIADVGQNAWEEIDVARAAQGGGRGLNFGWSAMEGNHRANDDQSTVGITPPVYEYPHGDLGCSISGGTVYRGHTVPALQGWYVFSDYCSGKVRAIRVGAAGTEGPVALGTVPGSVAVSAGPDGAMYVVAHDQGIIYRIDPA